MISQNVCWALLPAFLLTAGLGLPCAAQTAASNASTLSTQKTESLLEARAALVVRGIGEAQVAPGRIWLTVSILGDGDTDDEAIAEARRNADEAAAIIQKSMQPGAKLVWTKPTWNTLSMQEMQSRTKSYRAATKASTFYLTDVATTQKLVDALRDAKLAGSVFLQVDPVGNREAGYNQALRQAVRQARERASVLADASQLTRLELLGLRDADLTMPQLTNVMLTLQDSMPVPIPERMTVRANVTLYWGVPEGGKRPVITGASRTASKPTPKTPSRRP
jgi:uncharacterized protein YggE